MANAKRLLALVERCKSRKKKVKEALTQDLYDKMGIILRESSYFDFDPIDEEQGTYMVAINVAGKEILQVNTKLDENGNIVFDSYEVDEGGLKAMVEFIENKAKELQSGGEEG